MVFHAAHVDHFGSAGMPGRKISVAGKQTCLSSKRWDDPHVATYRTEFGPETGRPDLDHSGAGGTCGDKRDPVAVRRKVRLKVLPRIIGDIDFLTSLNATHINFVVPTAIGGESQHLAIGRPGR